MRVLRRICVAGLAATIPLALGCAGAGKLDWTSPGRDMWQRPADVVELLEIPEGASVADLGAGEGYFIPYLADAVGDEGRVYAVEVEDDLAWDLAARFDVTTNVETVRGEYTDPRLPDGRIGLVLIVNAYHHIEDREAYFARLLDDLSATGRLAVIEPNCETSGLLGLFVEDGHNSCAADVRRELRAAGYEPIASYDVLPVQLFEVFGRREGEHAMRWR